MPLVLLVYLATMYLQIVLKVLRCCYDYHHEGGALCTYGDTK